jgi:hypothetical protein
VKTMIYFYGCDSLAVSLNLKRCISQFLESFCWRRFEFWSMASEKRKRNFRNFRVETFGHDFHGAEKSRLRTGHRRRLLLYGRNFPGEMVPTFLTWDRFNDIKALVDNAIPQTNVLYNMLWVLKLFKFSRT